MVQLPLAVSAYPGLMASDRRPGGERDSESSSTYKIERTIVHARGL